MKNIQLFVLLFAIQGAQLVAQETKINVYEYPMEESALLWEVKGPKNESHSYLFGTMHMIQEEFYIYPDWMDTIVTRADVLVMELAGLPNPLKALKYIMLPEGSVWDYFNEIQEDSLIVWAKQTAGMKEKAFRSTFSKMKPFAIVQLSALKMMGDNIKSYEQEFQTLAESNKIELYGLETIADQMKLFDDMTMEEQAEMVMETIRENEEDAAKMLNQLQRTFHSQEIDSLHMLVQDEGGMIAAKENVFLNDRNYKWIPKIKEIIDQKTAFIAVGAGHLGGPEGVIRLLQKEGYTLTPVKL